MRKNYRFKLIKCPDNIADVRQIISPLRDIASKARVCHTCQEKIYANQECMVTFFIDSQNMTQRVNSCVFCAEQQLRAELYGVTQRRTYLRTQLRRLKYLIKDYRIEEQRAVRKSL